VKVKNPKGPGDPLGFFISGGGVWWVSPAPAPSFPMCRGVSFGMARASLANGRNQASRSFPRSYIAASNPAGSHLRRASTPSSSGDTSWAARNRARPPGIVPGHQESRPAARNRARPPGITPGRQESRPAARNHAWQLGIMPGRQESCPAARNHSWHLALARKLKPG